MRVTHVCGGSRSGSTRVVLDFVRRHDRARFEPAVCFFAIAPADPAVLAETAVPYRQVVKASRYDPFAIPRLAAALRSLETEVAVLHGFGAYSFGAPAARLAAIHRVIRYEHAEELYGVHYVLMVRMAARLCDSTVLVSRAVGAYLAAHRLPAPRAEVIPNGIDPTPFAGAPPPFSVRRTPLALMAARLDRAKDHETLLRAMALLRARAVPFELALAGDGPFAPSLKSLAAELGVADRVRFLGWRDDLPALLAEADVAVLSTRTEGFGLFAVEAMAAGRPTVATRVGALPEIVRHETDGLLVAPGSPEALADALARLAADPARARAMGESGRARVAAEFTLERTVRRFEAHLSLPSAR